MKLSSPLSPGRGLATRAVSAVLVFAVFVMGALTGGILSGGTAWANGPISTAIATATIEATATPTPSFPTIPAGRNLTPVIGTQTPEHGYNLPAFNCGDGATVKRVEWESNTWTVTLDCPNLKFKTAAGVSD